jgi:phage-related protein
MSQSISAYKILNSSSKQPTTRVSETNYGQGYRQIIQDGFNTDEEIWNVDFDIITASAANSLETILLNSVKGTTNYIAWTPDDESTSKYWTARDIMKRSIGVNLRQISCTLRREFPLI